jgi:AcrR family transcriptional regulator
MRPLKSTRDRIIQVARIVFANLSVYKTTMEDIARASRIGRRTIYSYFKSKDELYSEVVDFEINNIIVKLRETAASTVAADKKLEKFFVKRMEAVQELTNRNSSIKKDFADNIGRIETIRKPLDRGETDLLKKILDEGNQSGIFFVNNTNIVALIIQCQLKSLETLFIKDNFGTESQKILTIVTQTIFKGIVKSN